MRKEAETLLQRSPELWPTDEHGWLVKPNGKAYKPHTGQAQFHRDRAILRLLVGGRGSGKTTAGVQEAQKKIRAGEPGLILAPDEKHFKRSTWVQLNEWIPIDPDLTGLPTSPLVEHWSKGDKMIRFKTGSVVWYGGIKEPDSWRGPNVNWIWYDEPGRHPSKQSFLIPIGCLRVGHNPQMWLTTTPRGVLHWLYTVFVLQQIGEEVMEALKEIGLSADSGHLLSWRRVTTRENRENLSAAYYAMLLATYQGLWRKQEMEGEFVSFEGLVYDNYDPEVHIVPARTIEPWWAKYRVVDFGYKNPFVCQWWAVLPDGDLLRYREIYMTKRTVAQHSAQINQLSAAENIEATVCDWDAEDRATLEENGIATVPANKAIGPGIQAVYRRLALDERGRPTLYLMRDALVERDPMLVAEELPTCTEEEFPRYSWPTDREGRPRKEIPVDLFNHGMDDVRYLVAHVDGLEETGSSIGASPVAGYRG